MTTVDRARRAAADLLLCYQDARTTTEREKVAEVIASLSPRGDRALADLADDALHEAQEGCWP